MHFSKEAGFQGKVVAECIHFENEHRFLAVYRIRNDGLSKLEEAVELKIAVHEMKDQQTNTFKSGFMLAANGMGEAEIKKNDGNQVKTTNYVVTPKTGGTPCHLEPDAEFGVILECPSILNPPPNVRCHSGGSQVKIAYPDEFAEAPVDTRYWIIAYGLFAALTGGGLAALLTLYLRRDARHHDLIQESADKVGNEVKSIQTPFHKSVDQLCTDVSELVNHIRKTDLKTEADLLDFSPGSVSSQGSIAQNALKEEKIKKTASNSTSAAAKQAKKATKKGASETK